MAQVTRLLDLIHDGDAHAAERLLPLVYDELRRLAAVKLAGEKAGHTLQATALVHEAYVRLVKDDPDQHWNGRGHFFAAAAEAMRRILVEAARRKQSLKHGGGRRREDLDLVIPSANGRNLDLIALDEALAKLERKDPRKAQLVKLRFFAGLSMADCAQTLGIAVSTADADWSYARSWLRLEIGDAPRSE
jgi:RNA polymerase sigma factor (TIGR02999 family)